MGRTKKYRTFYYLSILFVVIFIISMIYDYINYNPIITSAPFYVNIIIRFIEFLIISIVFLIIGIVLKKKQG